MKDSSKQKHQGAAVTLAGMDGLQYVYHLTRVKMRQDVRMYSLGLVWWYLDPVINTLLLYFVMAVVLGKRTDETAIFLLTGLLMFRFLQSAITASCSSLNPALTLSSRIYVPKLAFVLRDCLAESIKLVVGVVFLFILAIVLGLRHISVPEVFAVTLVAVLFATGAASLVSLTAVFVRDVRPIIGYVFRALFFVSGTFFSLEQVPEKYRTLFLANPFALLMHEFRLAVTSPAGLDYGALSILAISSVAMLTLGAALLLRFDRQIPKYVI